MLVETYEVEEANSEAAALAADSEATDLIQRLNLSGQLKLTNPETATRFPYRKMTKEEAQVYGILCKMRSRLENYADGIIPIRVLQVAAHVIDSRFCDRLEVWHPESADIKDPVLVGIKGPEYGDRELFMLARWGAELPPFQELKELARKMWMEQRRSALSKIRSQIDAELSSDMADIAMGEMPTYYA